jgi:hypothetical protein
MGNWGKLMPSRLLCLSLCAVLAASLGACAGSRSTPAQARVSEAQALALPPTAPNPDVRYMPPPARQARGMPAPIASAPIAPMATGPVSPSNPSPGIVAVNRSVPQPLGPNSPPPSSFENSCSPAPYVFQSKAGYEAVRVKDCATDQLLYLPTSAQAQIGGYVAECQRRCGM